MADTLQSVSWHLRQACPFRQGEAVDVWWPAYQATWRLRAIDDAAARGDVFGDVVVTSVSYSREGKAPSGGFRVSEAVAPAGGLAEARQACGGCPANAFGPTSDRMAGCCGSVFLHPNDPEVEAALRSAIARHRLEAAYAGAFPKTSPLWYGLWIASPLSHAQLAILGTVLPELPEGNLPHMAQLRHACELAIRHQIPLHARLAPPGHTDFGFNTTFAHCPRCKMGSGERWQKQYSTNLTTCRCCGQSYVPAETASSSKDEYDDADRDLERQLGPADYAALRDTWHRRHASDPPTWLDQLRNGKPDLAFGVLAEASAPATQGSLLARLWHRLTGRG